MTRVGRRALWILAFLAAIFLVMALITHNGGSAFFITAYIEFSIFGLFVLLVLWGAVLKRRAKRRK